MKSLVFNNGDRQPAIGLGTWKIMPDDVHSTLINALKLGYRHIDCAAIYCNEKAIGQALEDAFSQGIVKRNELWITSKLWCNAHRKADVLPALEKTLSDLRLDYLDLYLMHWPIATRPENIYAFGEQIKKEDFLTLEEVPLAETWMGMKEAGIDQKTVRHIGVSNFSAHKLEQLTQDSGIKPEVNQVELHPFLQQTSLVSYCEEKEINLTAYSPLARGTSELMTHPVVIDIANRHSCEPGQAVLAWSIERGIAVIPKTTRIERLEQNIQSASITLSKADMDAITSLDRHHRYVLGTLFDECPFTYEELWDEPCPAHI